MAQANRDGIATASGFTVMANRIKIFFFAKPMHISSVFNVDW